jgi:hypothetical protein
MNGQMHGRIGQFFGHTREDIADAPVKPGNDQNGAECASKRQRLQALTIKTARCNRHRANQQESVRFER